MDLKTTKSVRNAFDESIYTMWIRRNYGVLLGIAIVAMFVGLISYPGILYSDSYSRIRFTKILNDSISAFFNGDASLYTPRMWLTVAPSFFILLSEKISGSIFMYTCIQSFFLLLSIYCALRVLLGNKNQCMIAYICMVTIPIVWGYSVYYEPSVGCIAALITEMVLIQKYDQIANKGDKLITLFLIVVCSFVAFGFRANAFTVLPILMIIIYKKFHCGKDFWKLGVAVCCGFFISIIGPRILNIDAMSSYAASFFWESVSTIQTMSDDTRDDYLNYYDDLFGEKFTVEAIERNIYKEDGASINPLLGDDLSQICVIIDDNASVIMNRYWKLIINEPKSFLFVKVDMMLHSLGVNRPLVFTEYDYDRWGQMSVFGFNDSKPRERFVGIVLSYIEFMGVFLRPWILYLASLVLIIVYRLKVVKEKCKMTVHEELFIMSVFYYGAFLINTQSFEFRYFFPAWLILVLIIFSLLIKIVSEFTCKKKFFAWITVVTVYLFTVFGTYYKYMQEGQVLLNKVEKEGRLLYYDGSYKVYMLDDSLAYVTLWKANTDYTFFLRCYMSDKSTINSDFSFANRQIDTSLFSEKIALVELPDESIDYLETGQMYGNTLFWGDRIELDR